MSHVLGAPLVSPGSRAVRHAVIVAHPDDEALWLSAALAGAARVVFCFGAPYGRPAKARARRNAVAASTLSGLVDLAIPESGAGFSFDASRPRWNELGIEISEARANARYRDNYAALLAQLPPLLSDVDEVYTHNPWGEYGHAEHVQVYRALSELQRTSRFVLWFSSYVSERSWPMAQALIDTPLWSLTRCAPCQVALARRLKRSYLRHRAWTWNWTHRWPREQRLYAQRPPPEANPRTLRGEALLDVAALRWWPPPRRPLQRSLL